MANEVSITRPVPERPVFDFRRNTFRKDLREIRRYRSLLWYLFTSGLRTEKAGTLLGFLWWLLDPLLLMFVYWFVFGVIFNRATLAYPIFILISLVAWSFFTKSLQRSMSQTLADERAMRQIAFPRSVIPIAHTATECAHFFFGIFTAVVLAAVFYGLEPSWRLLAFFGFAAGQICFTLGMAFFLAMANFFFRDISHLSSYMFRMWYYLSPGIYPLTRIPVRYRNLYELNPFATFFSGYHWAIMGREPLVATWAIVYAGALSVILLVGSYALFVRAAPRFVKLST